MKYLLLGLFVLATGSRASSFFSSPVEEYAEKFNWPKSGNAKEVREAIYTQWIDHSNHLAGTFEQTVYINEQYYYPGGPVLVFISAASDAYSYWLENSHMVNIADQLGGVIYALEPRYFGKSFPTQDLSLENFERYLQIDQTMGDYVSFITFLHQELAAFGSNKFVMVGHGRGGTLAAWLHQRYPSLANGIWAISAPVNTYFSFADYYKAMFSTMDSHFPATCQIVISEAFRALEVLVDDRNIERIREVFLLDSFNELDLANKHDVALFYYQLFDLLLGPVEYGVSSTIDIICSSLTPSSQYSSLELLGQYYGSSLYNRVFQYDLFVSILKQESLDVQYNHDRQSLYIACSGWANFKTSEQLPYPVNLRFDLYVFGDLCYDVFGLPLYEVVNSNYMTNVDHPISQWLPNAYFTNAEFDPHRIIAVQSDKNPTSPHFFIGGIGKLYDFFRVVYPDYYSDDLQLARNKATDLITLWTRP